MHNELLSVTSCCNTARESRLQSVKVRVQRKEEKGIRGGGGINASPYLCLIVGEIMDLQ